MYQWCQEPCQGSVSVMSGAMSDFCTSDVRSRVRFLYQWCQELCQVSVSVMSGAISGLCISDVRSLVRYMYQWCQEPCQIYVSVMSGASSGLCISDVKSPVRFMYQWSFGALSGFCISDVRSLVRFMYQWCKKPCQVYVSVISGKFVGDMRFVCWWQDMAENVDTSEIQNVTSVSAPITVVVEHLYHDHFQVVRMILVMTAISVKYLILALPLR